MYKCTDCQQFFKEPWVGIMEPETGYTPCACPFCGSDTYEEAHECACTNNYTVDTFCDDCKDRVSYALSELKKALGFNQDDFEDIISDHFGW